MEEKKKEKLEKAPNSLIFVSLASMYLDNGMVNEAIDLCKSGLEIEPQNEEAHLVFAKAEIEKGNKEDAKKRLKGILERNPENTAAKELLEQIETIVYKEQKEEEKEKEEKKEEGEKGGEKEREEKLTPEVVSSIVVEVEKEEVISKEKEEEKLSEQDESEKLLVEKIYKINQIKGVINCFFRLKNGRFIKTPQLVVNINDLLPLLDGLLDSIKSAAKQLDMGKLKLIFMEIEKGVFYIFEEEDYDCFLLSHNSDNFGLVKAILPKLLANTSHGDE